MRVLILDFDFFTALGGGQTLYRRIVERHPAWEFWFPSRGPDLRADVRARMPSNARPFAFDTQWFPAELIPSLECASWDEQAFVIKILQVAAPLQGLSFDVVEVPSFSPISHFVRPIFSAFDIAVGRLSIGLVGWLSVSNANAFSEEVPTSLIDTLEQMERRSSDSSDVRYTISDMHAAENPAVSDVEVIDMHDALENIPPPSLAPPGEGPPDVWYVGRLDRNKGPDIFIEMVSRIPRHLYRGCHLCGPDNTWMQVGERWSDAVLKLARERNVQAEYLGEMPHDELWERVYRGRSVLTISSRADAFNYVSVEALASGCPIVLSERAGAAEFLQARHPEIAPPIMNPDDLDGAAVKLRGILDNYESAAADLRANLHATPWPRPRNNFLAPAFMKPATPGQVDFALLERIRAAGALETPAAVAWRSVRPTAVEASIAVIVHASRNREALVRTLVSLRAGPALSVVIIDDGALERAVVLEVVKSYTPTATLVMQGDRGMGAVLQRGLSESQAEYLCFVETGDGLDGEALVELRDLLSRDATAGAALGAWWELDAAGRVVSACAPQSPSPRALALGRQGTQGSAALIRRSVIASVGGIDSSMDELALLDLWIRLAAAWPVLLSPRRVSWRWPSGTHRSLHDRSNRSALLGKLLADAPV